MIQATIFDLDGVIVDTERIHFLTFKTTLADLGIEIPEKRWYREFTGIGSKNILKILFQEKNIKEEIDFWFEKRRENFFDYVKKNDVVTIPGVESFLKELKLNNIPTAIATGSGRSVATFLLAKVGLTNYFDKIVTADDVVNKKPHPEIYLTAASLLNSKPDQCVIFEDSRNGVAAAKAAGAKVVGIESPSLPTKDCDLVIKNFEVFSFSKLQRLFL